MNEAEIKAQANAARIVRVTNPFDFDFTHAWGGVPYTLPMGKPLLFPFPLADHLATHLARQALIRQSPMRDASETDGKGSDRPLWSDERIEKIKKDIMVEEYREEAPVVKTEAELLRQKIDDLNAQFAEFKESLGDDAAPVIVNDPIVPVVVDSSDYKDKSEVIAELNKRGIRYDARGSKTTLEKLLN